MFWKWSADKHVTKSVLLTNKPGLK